MHSLVYTQMWPRLLAVALGVCSYGLSAVRAEELSLLTTAIQIRSMSPEEAARAQPVRIRGTVIGFTPGADVFVQDDTAGTFFRAEQLGDLKPGDIVEVSGVTHVGLYLPGIGPAPYRIVGQGPLPAAIPVRHGDLLSGRYHYQRVSIEGVVRSETQVPNGQALLRVGTESRIVELKIEPSIRPAGMTLVGSRIRAAGMAAGAINMRRQLVQPYLQLSNWDEISVLTEALPEEQIPLVSGKGLMTFRVSERGDPRVRIEGTVTACFPKGLIFVRSDQTAFGVCLSDATRVAVGDSIEAIGFPEMERFSASVMDARLVARRPGPGPEPVELDIETLLRGLHDSDLIAVTARVTDQFKSEDGLVLTLQTEGRAMQARVPASQGGLQIGSLVRAVGISVVESAVGSRYLTQPESVSLRIRQPEDLVVLKSPSGWTVRRLGGILAVLGGFVLLAGLWITILRRQVSRQTAALRESIESEAALQERQRIAREFHDTLEQELAGLSLRLDAAATRGIDDKARILLAASRSLVSRIQAETRNLIIDLRTPAESAGDLVAALQELVEVHGALPGAEVRLTVSGTVPVLRAATIHHLRMIAGEGVTNALKHAEASLIELRVAVEDNGLVVRVIDNGKGFNADTETRGRNGHFGCVGIRERSRKIGATAGWSSQPGKGATLTMVVPLSRAAGAPSEGREPTLAERVI